uniref:Uncharacterized protein n=1 Tax=Rhizophora mucronata TaxID=61149 RepID=A0A2P2PS54_RHIMU
MVSSTFSLYKGLRSFVFKAQHPSIFSTIPFKPIIKDPIFLHFEYHL